MAKILVYYYCNVQHMKTPLCGDNLEEFHCPL